MVCSKLNWRLNQITGLRRKGVKITLSGRHPIPDGQIISLIVFLKDIQSEESSKYPSPVTQVQKSLTWPLV